MKEFLLLFRGGDDNRIAAQQSPEKWQQHMMKWKSWMEALGKQGKFLSGQPLAQGGSVIRGGKKVVTDGPFVEGKEIVGGYLMIKARDLGEAVDLSKNCPIFEFDGTVEVREVQQLEM
ncbi:MAG TPA: YciI family protein [Bacteroidota bacterium]|nr:YciI family protein [Bacteroidota bacterium]